MAGQKLITLANLTTFANEIKTKYAKQSEFATLQEEVEALEAASGEHNKIEVVKVNGSALPITPEDRSVDIEVPKDTNDLTNGAEFQSKTEVEAAINAKISSAYKAAGSVEADKFLTAPSQEEEGNVYNSTEPFSTNENFVESEIRSYPAGTNVVVVRDSDTYKYDVLAGFVDLTEYAKNDSVDTKISTAIEGLKISDYVKTTAMEAYVGTQLGKYYDKTAMDSKLEGYVQTTAIEDMVTNESLSTTLAAYVKTSDITEITESEIKALLA